MFSSGPPEQTFVWKESADVTHAIALVGTFRWEIEFLALTGSSYQQACEGMGAQFDEFAAADKEERTPRILNPGFAQLAFDLAFSACAKWRRESGWDRRHAKDGDDLVSPRERGPYLAFVDRLRRPDVVRLQCAVTRLLYAYNYDPGLAAAKSESGDLLRPSDPPPPQ